jgi:hypothetical protein
MEQDDKHDSLWRSKEQFREVMKTVLRMTSSTQQDGLELVGSNPGWNTS